MNKYRQEYIKLTTTDSYISHQETDQTFNVYNIADPTQPDDDNAAIFKEKLIY